MTDHRPELRPLTAFRFFAAVAVFLRHVYPWFHEGGDAPSLAARIASDGFCGVTFFFVLSGFILTYNYRAAFTDLRPPAIWSFYAARVARIGPVHWLTFAIALPVIHQEILAAPASFIGPALTNLTLTQSCVPAERYFFSFNSVSWSLSDEIFFYALFPLTIWGMHAARCDRPRRAAALALGLWLVAMICVVLGQNLALGFWLWYVNPAFRLFDFLVGVALGQLFLSLKERGASGPSPRWATVLEAGSLLLVGLALLASREVPYLLRRSAYYTPFFAAVIVIFAFQRGALSRFLSGNSLRVLGEASFSFYMFHYLFIRMTDRYPHVTHLGDWPPLARSLGVFVISLSVSLCCYRWYEIPARRLLRGWLTRRGERADNVLRPMPSALAPAIGSSRAMSPTSSPGSPGRRIRA